VLRTVQLPNATIGVFSAVTACDGSLYVAEMRPQLAHVARDGTVTEYPVDLYSVNELVRGSDCRIWFIGSNDDAGTLDLVPAKS
jgi:hypothetical protein